MQTGTVSRLWLCGRSWRFKIHFWRNIMYFRKSYICSNKLDVQETNCCFSQFNRIWNHLSGHWTEIGWVACSGIMGSNCFCSWKCFSCFRWIRETWEWCSQTSQASQEKSMWWKTLMLFLQMSNPRVKKLYCMCLRTTKQWSKWLWKAEVLQWDMFPEPTELPLIGYSIELIWTQNPNQIHRHQKPTRRHTDKGKFHTWWMESSFVFLQHPPFQFHQLSWSDVEKNARRCRWRKSHSKMEVDDEFGLAMQRKGS